MQKTLEKSNAMSQSFENAQQSFVGNVMSSGQFQQQMNQIPQNPFLSLFNVSGFQNNFYQQPNIQALQQLANNENVFNQGFSTSPYSVIDNNKLIRAAQRFNIPFVQQTPMCPALPSMNSEINLEKNPLLASKMQSDHGFEQMFNGENDSFKFQATSTPIKLDQKMKLLYALQRIALKGCESATQIFQNHSKRPYFKKIDLICDRLKQDLGVTDKAVININSHGVAWAIKDLIFVFNRIISGWVILRDYFYSNSDGMSCVTDSLDPNLANDFMKWQEATEKLANSLVNSFENLHISNQRNSNRKGSTNNSLDNSSSSTTSARLPNNFQKIFDPLIAENSEQIQLGGGYMKSAVYKPISSSEGSMTPRTPDSTRDIDSMKLLLDEVQSDRKAYSMPLYKRCSSDSSEKAAKRTSNRFKMNLTEKFEAVNLNNNMDGALFDYLFSCPETL